MSRYSEAWMAEHRRAFLQTPRGLQLKAVARYHLAVITVARQILSLPEALTPKYAETCAEQIATLYREAFGQEPPWAVTTPVLPEAIPCPEPPPCRHLTSRLEHSASGNESWLICCTCGAPLSEMS